jgi:hypothetical protein
MAGRCLESRAAAARGVDNTGVARPDPGATDFRVTRYLMLPGGVDAATAAGPAATRKPRRFSVGLAMGTKHSDEAVDIS